MRGLNANGCSNADRFLVLGNLLVGDDFAKCQAPLKSGSLFHAVSRRFVLANKHILRNDPNLALPGRASCKSRHLTRPARLEQKRGRVYNQKEGKPCPPKSSTRESVGSSSASQRLPVTVHGRHRRGEMAFRDVDLEDVGRGEKATQDKLEREIRGFLESFQTS